MSVAPPRAAHFDGPVDAAAHLAGMPAVIVAGPDAMQTAAVAVAIARAAAATRRVAIGDLIGGSSAIHGLAGGEDAVGLAECFRDGLSLNEVARPVAGVDSLFVLPAGLHVDREPALGVRDRWERLIRGFAEADGLLVLVCRERSPLIRVLGEAGAALLYAGRADGAPAGAVLAGTIGGAGGASSGGGTAAGGVPGIASPAARGTRRTVRPWQIATLAALTAAVVGWVAIAWVRHAYAPTGAVSLRPASTIAPPQSPTRSARGGAPAPPVRPDTIQVVERTPASDRVRLAPFAIAVVAVSTADNANSVLRTTHLRETEPAATVSIVAVPSGSGRAARWHKVMFGAWRDASSAQAGLAEARRRGVLDDADGIVMRAPFAILLADSTSRERARAVMEVWVAKGVVPYALTQDDGTLRVYAGAFETVAQAVTMAALVHAAGGGSIVAYRTGRPD